MTIKGVIIGLFMVVVVMIGNALASDTYDYASSCPQSPDRVDKWSFYTCECTSYSADKMNEHGVGLWNYYKGVHWGYARNWKNAAMAARISCTTTPKHRDIAWWAPSSANHYYGHVAYVESVDSSGNITVSEYNWAKPFDYGTRAIKRGSSSYPQSFIHFGAK